MGVRSGFRGGKARDEEQAGTHETDGKDDPVGEDPKEDVPRCEQETDQQVDYRTNGSKGKWRKQPRNLISHLWP